MLINAKIKKANDEKPIYVCGISGCRKQYRSANTLSYHRKTVHKLIQTVSKPLMEEK